MKIKPKALSKRHLGMLCVVRFHTEGTGFIGHSQRYGLQRGSTPTSYILVGKLHGVDEEKLTFTDCHYSKHVSSLSWSLGPRYSFTQEPYDVYRKNLNKKTEIVLNHHPSSNAVMQHLTRINKSEFWNRERRIASMLKEKRTTP